MNINQEYLKEALAYDPVTGIFSWKIRPVSHFKPGKVKTALHICNMWNSKMSGKTTGYVKKGGYLEIGLDNKLYLSHRLAWFYVYGEFPSEEIDHIDGRRANNCISNLRSVTRLENNQNTKRRKNNTSGTVGVSPYRDTDRWVAYISANGDKKHLGYFDDISEAIAVRKRAELKYGFHKNHGRTGEVDTNIDMPVLRVSV